MCRPCISELVPREAIEAMVLAASRPMHDDGHTDCYYAGLLLAALEHLPVAVNVEILPGNTP